MKLAELAFRGWHSVLTVYTHSLKVWNVKMNWGSAVKPG